MRLDARRQVLLFLGAYLVYSMSRWVAVGDLAVATDHARWIADGERSAGVEVEGRVQQALEGTALLWLLGHRARLQWRERPPLARPAVMPS